MQEAEILDGLTEIFRDLFANPSLTLTEHTTAKDIPGWDSFNHINILSAAEERFGARIGAREAEKLTDVGALVRLIAAKQAK